MEAPVLCIDIGNSAVKVGYFSSDGLPTEVRNIESPTDIPEIAGQIAFIDTRMDSEWRNALLSRGAVELTVEKGIPFPSKYTTQLGPDRAAQLTAVWESGTFPAIIISLGTACTMDYIDAHGVHQGGIITPGINLRLRALSEKTGRLPLVSAAPLHTLLGKSTKEAIQIGVVSGFCLELNARIKQLRRSLGPFRIWITGGEAHIIKDTLSSDAIFAPDLTLRGVWLWQRYLRSFGGS
ncbi:MAG: type III pantothenate kinase [Bacteroidia bacterium]|nr:type III pantothenate kinase [Bacteroidia bacterium]MDW8416645.1 type III pantothenate kinase [Bacteroidia bacterium]